MDYLERARRVFEIEVKEASAVCARLDANFGRAVELIKEAVENRGKVVVLGVGKSGHIGEKIAATLTSTGSPAVVLNSLNALHGDLGVVADGDVVLALSYSGETDELLAVLPAITRMGLRIVAITGGAESSLAKSAEAVLDVRVSQEACPLNLAPTSSTTAMLILGDALAMALLEARGFRKEDFARFHPGGSLGRSLLLRVSQIMRPASEMVILSPESTVLEAVQGMTARRAGAAVIVGPDGRLAGIFTHGDFARHFPSCPDIGPRAVGDFMTKNPVTIPGDKLAAEVLQVLERHRIDDLVVVNASGEPVGMVDSQDLSRLKILQRRMLLAFHKPFGVLSQFSPDGSRHRRLSEFGFPPGVYPIGRLDADSEGLLLLSDEPFWNERLLRPGRHVEKTYLVLVEREPGPDALRKLEEGIMIDGRRTLPARARLLDPQPHVPPRDPPVRLRKAVRDFWIELRIVEGRNRQVRRMTAGAGHPTIRLIRKAIGSLELGDLPAGIWRKVEPQEAALLVRSAPVRG